jgi:hypothetical protein
VIWDKRWMQEHPKMRSFFGARSLPRVALPLSEIAFFAILERGPGGEDDFQFRYNVLICCNNGSMRAAIDV